MLRKMLLPALLAAAAGAAGCAASVASLGPPGPTEADRCATALAPRGGGRPLSPARDADGMSVFNRWENVMALPNGARLSVHQSEGSRQAGLLARATADALEVVTAAGAVWIDRARVVRVVQELGPVARDATAAARSIAEGAATGANAFVALSKPAIGRSALPVDGKTLVAGAVAGAAVTVVSDGSSRRVLVYEVKRR